MKPRDSDIEILEIVGLDDTGPADEPFEIVVESEPEPEAEAPQPPRRPDPLLSRARSQGRRDGIREILAQLLDPLDALEQCYRESPDADELREGVRLALRAFFDVFRHEDLERIEGDAMPFDPAVHEAISTRPSDRVPDGTVLEVLRVGYMLGGELVRPAMVIVSRASAADPSEERS